MGKSGKIYVIVERAENGYVVEIGPQYDGPGRKRFIVRSIQAVLKLVRGQLLQALEEMGVYENYPGVGHYSTGGNPASVVRN